MTGNGFLQNGNSDQLSRESVLILQQRIILTMGSLLQIGNNSDEDLKRYKINNSIIERALYQNLDKLRYHMKIITGDVIKDNVLKLFIVRR